MVFLAEAAPFASWWLLAISAGLLLGIFFAWLHFHKIRSLERLMDSEQRLKDLMDKAPVGIVAYRKRSLVYANEACLKLMGMPSVEEMSRRNPMDFFAPHERERIMGYIAARELGQPAPGNYEVFALRATGETFPMTVQISQAMLQDGPVALMFLEDATDRHTTRTALEKSETDYRGLFESAHDAILIFDPADELILDANQRACEMYGLSREQLVGRSLVEFSTDVATGRRQIQEVESNAVLTGYQTTHRRHDGTLIILDVNASIVEYKGHRAILSIQRDISERRKAEDALRKSEENYRLLVENQTDLVVKTDRQGRFLFVSPSYCELFGKTESELLGKAFLPVVNEDDQPASTKAMKALEVWPHTARFEQRAMTARGWRWISWSHRAVLDSEGRMWAVVGVGRDVTERKAAEEALKESEQLFRALAESSSVTIAIYQDGRLVYTNPCAEKLSGYTAEELSGMPLADLMHDDYRELLLKRAKARQQGEPVLSQYEAPLRRKDGGTRWLLISAARVTYKGQPAGIIAAFDVTERRTAEERVRQSAHEIQAIFKALPDLYFRMDARGQILEWRSGSDEDVLLRPEQITGKTVQEILPPDAAAVVIRALHEVQRGARVAVAEYSLPLPQGELFFEARLAPLFENQVVAVVRNVTERRRAQAEKEAWKLRFDLVSAASGQVVYDYHVPSGNILWSGSVKQVLGYPPGEMGNIDEWSERIHPEDRAEAVRLLDEAERYSMPYDVDYRFRHRDGHYVHIHDRGFFRNDAAGKTLRMVGMMADVTENRRTLQALQQSEERFRRTFDLSPVGAAMVGMDLRFLKCNQAFCTFLGYEEEELIGRTFLEVTHPEDLAVGRKQIRGVAAGEIDLAHFQKRYLRKDGQVAWGELTIRVVPETEDHPAHFLTIIQDITERKHVETALRQSDERFRTLFESSPDPAWIIDGHRFVECNQAAIDMLGYPDKESLRNTHPSELSPEFQPDGEPSYSKAERMMFTAQEKGIYRFEWVHRRWDKSDFFAEVTLATITIQGRQVIYCLWRDISDRKRAEEELLRAFHTVEDEKAKTDAVLETMGDGISIQDLDLKILYQNEVHKALAGDHVGESCYRAYEGSDQVCAGCPVALAYADGNMHTTVRSKSTPGGTIHVEITASPLRDHTGAIVAGIECARDITGRMKAEEALRASEHRYRTLMDSANDPIFIADADTGVLLDANLKAQEMIGRNLEEIRGMHQMELHPPEDRDRYTTMFKDHVQKGHAMGEVFVQHRDGRRIPVEISSSTVEVNGRKINQGIFRNVTERKLAEAALVESERRLRKIIEQSPISMAIVAMDGTIEYINQKAIETFGYEPEDIPTMDRWWVLAYPEEGYRQDVIATYMGLVEKAIAENRDIEGREYRVTCKDGTLKTVFIFGIPVADKVFVMFQDVTEQKRAEEALRARLEQHRALVENARAIILQWKTDLTITFWNDYAAEFFNFTREEALGANLLDTIVPRTETSGRDLEVMIRDIASDPNHYAANINENVTKDGRRVWVAWSNRPMVDGQGRLTSILSIGTDITELKRAEDELRLRNQQLLAVAASAQAVGQFVDTQAVTRSICEAAISAFDASMAWVGLVVPETTEVTPLASAGRDAGFTDQVRVRWDLSPRAMGPTGRAIKTRRPQVMHVDEPEFAPWRDEALKRGFRSVCALPLAHGETIRGVLTLYSEDPAAFGPETFDILEIFASQCSMVLVNAALYEEARRTIQELWKANEALKDGKGELRVES